MQILTQQLTVFIATSIDQIVYSKSTAGLQHIN